MVASIDAVVMECIQEIDDYLEGMFNKLLTCSRKILSNEAVASVESSRISIVVHFYE